MTTSIYGVYPPIVTIFKEDGSFDEEGQVSHVDFLIENGVHGIIPCGSTGEFITMTIEERKRVADVTIKATDKRVPVYVGAAHYSTVLTIELCQHAEKAGADGVMLITPYYLPRYPEELTHYYETIAKAINIPIMLYHNPHFSGITLSDEFIADLYKRGVITSVKEGEGEVARLNDLRYLTDDNFALFYGYDTAPIEAIVTGADGWVAGTANVLPAELSQLYQLAKDKKVDEAVALWHKIKPYMNLCTKPREGKTPPWLAILKEGLSMRGQAGGYPRKPAFTLDEMGNFGARVKEDLGTALAALGHV
ncbi:MAG: dihydrodipicolinate synthase family protein [Anaerolineae bacterium]|nr:dihydrodipicolinate synthase family protein [Anaerolineae bacterium]